MVYTGAIQLKARGDCDIHDITAEVSQVVRQSGLNAGIVTIFCPSSTSALTTIEYESGACADLERLLDEIVDPRREYQHNLRWRDGNGHSHVRSALLGPALTVPFVDGRPTLGTWQQIVYLDFDNRPRSRKLVVQVMGE